MKRVALLPVHGMGETPADFADELAGERAGELGATDWAKVDVEPVCYQALLQANERAVFDGYDIRWRNFYDEDDPLGWPLRPLGSSYRAAVEDDVAVNAGGSLLGHLTRAWNPFSHSRYWRDGEITSICRGRRRRRRAGCRRR